MGYAMLTSFLLVYVLMVILYSSFLTPFVIMFSVPLALVGALYGLALTHETLNLFSLIGIIMLFGLVAKNGILMVDYANTQRHRGLRVLEAVRTAAGIRLRPIVMTTASMVFGMLPLALGLSEGAEFRQSMGTVLIGGLLQLADPDAVLGAGGVRMGGGRDRTPGRPASARRGARAGRRTVVRAANERRLNARLR